MPTCAFMEPATEMALDPYIQKGDMAISLKKRKKKRHGAYRHEKKTTYYRHDIGYCLNLTRGIGFYYNRHKNSKNNDRGHCHLSKSTGGIGDPPLRATVK